MSVHLSIENLCVEFNGFRAVTDLNLTVNKGELRCLIGPNGAGKTTALDLICGKTKPTSGAIRYKGTDLAQQEEYLIARAGVGRKFQVPSVFRQLSVRQNLEVAFCRHTGVAANVLRPGQSSESDGLEKLADFVGLIDQLDVPAAHLSHGQTQWLEIALLLAQDSELILLDELSLGLAPIVIKDLYDLLPKIVGNGMSAILVEQDVTRALGTVNHFMCLQEGHVSLEGTPGAFTKDQISAAYFGT